VNDAVPASAKYKNRWAVSIFAEWQRLREVKVLVLDCGGLFKDYDLHKVTALSADIAGMDALSLNYWLSKFVEVDLKTVQLMQRCLRKNNILPYCCCK